MSTDKVDPSKKEETISSADDLTKTTKKGDVELTEDELKRATGGVTFSDINITKKIDKASPVLFQDK